jgi:hypothetical protein
VTQQATEGFSDRMTSSLARHRSVERRPPIAMRRVIVAMSQGKNRRSRVATTAGMANRCLGHKACFFK